MVTLEDVSRHSGVSTATVSRVINRSAQVNSETRRRVEQAVRELGYIPCHAAQTLARQTTRTIGVILPDMASGFYADVLKGIDQEAYYGGYHLMVAFSHGKQDEEDIVMRYLSGRRVDGLVVMNLALSDEFIDQMAVASTPVIFMDHPTTDSRFTSVVMDNAGGVHEAMKHLLDVHGHRSIAVISGPRDSYDSRQRLDAVQASMKQAGLDLPPSMIWHGDFTEAGGYKAMDLWLGAGRELPQAIFAFSDLMAVGAMDCLRHYGKTVPDDVALIGCDDIPLARHVGLSTIQLPMEQLGRLAANTLLMSLCEEGRAPTTETLKTRFIVRRSCGCTQ